MSGSEKDGANEPFVEAFSVFETCLPKNEFFTEGVNLL